MDLKASITTKMEQGLALLPQMLQSIEVLQLTTLDLLSLIDRELEQNETLVAEPRSTEPTIGDERNSTFDEDRAEPDGWDRTRIGSGGGDEDPKLAMLANLPDREETLREHIARQIEWLGLSPEIAGGVRRLAELLDDRGLLTLSENELLEVLDAAVLDRCLDVLRALEPRGIGGRDTIEAMLLQIGTSDPDREDILALLTTHLDDVARNRLRPVARALGRSVDEISDLIARIRRLDPRPGARFARGTAVAAVRPEVRVRLAGERIEIELDDMTLPDLGVDEEYQAMVSRRQTDATTRDYLRGKLRSARDLIYAVEQRKRTLGRVCLAVMERQREFLHQGPLAVCPLAMSVVAEDVGLHASTVSRAIAGKFVQTDHGIFPLRSFFDGNRGTAPTGGVGKGRMAIRDHVRDLVQGEDPAQPLSDEGIVRGLLLRNIKVARRTVAKYRKELGIASSWRRREYDQETP